MTCTQVTQHKVGVRNICVLEEYQSIVMAENNPYKHLPTFNTFSSTPQASTSPPSPYHQHNPSPLSASFTTGLGNGNSYSYAPQVAPQSPNPGPFSPALGHNSSYNIAPQSPLGTSPSLGNRSSFSMPSGQTPFSPNIGSQGSTNNIQPPLGSLSSSGLQQRPAFNQSDTPSVATPVSLFPSSTAQAPSVPSTTTTGPQQIGIQGSQYPPSFSPNPVPASTTFPASPYALPQLSTTTTSQIGTQGSQYQSYPIPSQLPASTTFPPSPYAGSPLPPLSASAYGGLPAHLSSSFIGAPQDMPGYSGYSAASIYAPPPSFPPGMSYTPLVSLRTVQVPIVPTLKFHHLF